MKFNYESAKQDLLSSQDIECLKFFKKHNCYLELGYFYLINDSFGNAKKYFKKIADVNIRAHWAYFLVELIEGNISYYPTYFELRNFLEIDLDFLIKHFKGDYVEKIVNYSDFLSSINSEVNKFIGRVFFINGMEKFAKIYFERAKNSFYNDPELHFLIAQVYLNDKEFNDAKNSLNTCLKILPEYYPAEKLLKELTENKKL